MLGGRSRCTVQLANHIHSGSLIFSHRFFSLSSSPRWFLFMPDSTCKRHQSLASPTHYTTTRLCGPSLRGRIYWVKVCPFVVPLFVLACAAANLVL
eukprot:scaffold187105_cov31-Tisochrysis_lutea.AAC.1